MKTLNLVPNVLPNMVAIAKKQMTKDVAEGCTFPTEIKGVEKDSYHVVILDSTPNAKTLKFVHKYKHQIFDRKAWKKTKDMLPQLGYGKVFIYHNPTVEMVEVEPTEEIHVDLNEGGGDGNVKISREDLITKAKELGYEGALNVKDKVFRTFIDIEEAKKAVQELGDL